MGGMLEKNIDQTMIILIFVFVELNVPSKDQYAVWKSTKVI